MDLSVVVPVYNEEENVIELARSISAALRDTEWTCEIIFVDDGSTDATFQRLASETGCETALRVIKLRRNFGQTPAMQAGIDAARGKYIATLDGDLQNDPQDIPRLIKKLEEGYDLVAGWRQQRQDKFWTRRLPSMIANRVIGRITGIRVRDNGCSLKAYRASIFKQIHLYSEMHRFIPAMSSLAGVRIAQLPVRHHPRTRGQSKYGLSRVGKVILDLWTVKMLIASSEKPLQWFCGLSLPFLAVTALSLGAIALRFAHVGGNVGIVYPGLCILSAYLFFHMIVMGLLGDLVVKTGARHGYRAVKRI